MQTHRTLPSPDFCEGIDNEVEIGRISKGDDSMMKTLVFILPQEFTKASWIQLFFNVYYPSPPVCSR